MATQICSQCGHQGKVNKSAKGSFIVEAILWLIFLVIGLGSGIFPLLAIPLAYTLYRMFASRDPRCPKCGAPNTMVPLNSPKGKELVGQYGTTDA